MTQRTIYECDECGVEIGSVAHLTLHVANNGNASGVALPPDEKIGHWHVSGFPRNFVHLHFKCVSKFFNALHKKATTSKE